MKKVRNQKKSGRLGILGLIIGILFSMVFSHSSIIFLIPILGAFGAIAGAIMDREKLQKPRFWVLN